MASAKASERAPVSNARSGLESGGAPVWKGNINPETPPSSWHMGPRERGGTNRGCLDPSAAPEAPQPGSAHETPVLMRPSCEGRWRTVRAARSEADTPKQRLPCQLRVSQEEKPTSCQCITRFLSLSLPAYCHTDRDPSSKLRTSSSSHDLTLRVTFPCHFPEIS